MDCQEARRQAEHESDHCTGVVDIYADCCLEHDIHYRCKDISRRAADAAFRRCIQSKSKLGKLSPVSWFRWLGVRTFGWVFD